MSILARREISVLQNVVIVALMFDLFSKLRVGAVEVESRRRMNESRAGVRVRYLLLKHCDGQW